ncbi:hypothetical protein D9756_000631 [Leucocoprinus leucothites]|uniref:Uncharacterized protein n=1 Tax=Leucocoprinus leucothites TaxID=201217 RepID=A0A8H5GG25_9AGAR|nr:hypothetical protein D9756_000631 [Leucoagaricus leucothites]
MLRLYALALWISCLAALVAAIPTFEHLTGWDDDMGSLVPGAAYVSVIGRRDAGFPKTRYLNVHDEGAPGNLTATTEDRRPEWFYIRKNQLYQVINSTAIYPVNIKNMTGTSDFPLQILSGQKKTGNRYGSWRWQGSMLFYEEGKMSNSGLFYECLISGGRPGIFTFLQPTKTPDKCSPVTLHAFNKLFLKEQPDVPL